MVALKRLVPIVGAILAVAAATSYGHRGAGPGPGGGPGAVGASLEDLTAEQREAIREIALEQQKEMITLRAEMEAKSLELQELVRAEAGEAAIFAKLDEIGALRNEMMKKRMAMRLEIRAQLTAEQKERFDQEHMMMGRMGPGGLGFGDRPGRGGRFE